jgi:site-specific recombinase XerD
MTIPKAIELFRQHQKGSLRKSTLKSYGKFLGQIEQRFVTDEVATISSEDIGKFLDERTEGLSRSTRHLRYAQIKAFFNYVIETSDLNIKNPCDATMLLKTFKNVGIVLGRYWTRRQLTRLSSIHSASEIG